MKYFNKMAFVNRLQMFHQVAKPLKGVAKNIRGGMSVPLGSKAPRRVMTPDVQDFLTGVSKKRMPGKNPSDLKTGKNLKALITASNDYEIAGAGVIKPIKAMRQSRKALMKNPRLANQYDKALRTRNSYRTV